MSYFFLSQKKFVETLTDFFSENLECSEFEIAFEQGGTLQSMVTGL